MKLVDLTDYKLILERKPLRLWTSGNSNKYICYFKFYTNLNIHLFDLVFNEKDIVKLMEQTYDLLEFNFSNTSIYFDSTSSNTMSYGFNIELDNMDNWITVIEYNPIIDIMIERLKFYLGENIGYTILDFLQDIYEEFLSDIPDLSYLKFY